MRHDRTSDDSRPTPRRLLPLGVALVLVGVPVAGCKLASNPSRSTRAQPATVPVTTAESASNASVPSVPTTVAVEPHAI